MSSVLAIKRSAAKRAASKSTASKRAAQSYARDVRAAEKAEDEQLAGFHKAMEGMQAVLLTLPAEHIMPVQHACMAVLKSMLGVHKAQCATLGRKYEYVFDKWESSVCSLEELLRALS